MVTEADFIGEGYLPADAFEVFIKIVDKLSVIGEIAKLDSRPKSDHLVLPRWTQDPDAAWVGELEEIPESEVAGDEIVESYKKLAALVPSSEELIEDSPHFLTQLLGALGRAYATKLDKTFFTKRPLLANGDPDLRVPKGLQDQAYTRIDAGPKWSDLDVFLEAKAEAAEHGAPVDSFVANPLDHLALKKLTESATSKRKLLQPDPTAAAGSTIDSTRVIESTHVQRGQIWALNKSQNVVAVRQDAKISKDESSLFRKGGVLHKVVGRAAFAYQNPQGIVAIELNPGSI